jgi:methionine sulfoxide reductase heme-binding subunit
MPSWLTQGELLWFANRATGVVLIGLLTLSTAMGVFSTARAGSRRWPRFATQALHRNVALLTMAMLVVHIASAVADTFVNIRWWDALVPFLGLYSRLWLGVGTVASDMMIAVVATSLVRHRLDHRRWRIVHLLSYLAWVIGVLHGIGIGTDSRTTWGMSTTALSVGVVAAFAVLRLATLAHERRIEA